MENFSFCPVSEVPHRNVILKNYFTKIIETPRGSAFYITTWKSFFTGVFQEM